jgi:ubiquinone/menaquinone biosynthesis C-methylase UbiE
MEKKMSTKKPLPQSPSGFTGMIFGKIMEWTNSDSYRKAINALKPSSKEHFLEIGFGTGLFAEMLLLNTPDAFMAGIDPTSTMVETANKRLNKHGFGKQVDFRVGTDEALNWNEKYFDGVIAIHSFQFWHNPEKTIKHISRVLKSDGRIVIVFRDHSSNPPAWLPNPISRTGQEVEMAIKLLEQNGYSCVEYPAAGSSRIIRANRIK